jgi:hypothetical protein
VHCVEFDGVEFDHVEFDYVEFDHLHEPRYDRSVIPQHVRPLFWDIAVETFDPQAWPRYTIERVLEHGADDDVQWLRRIVTPEQIQGVLRTTRRLSPRSATFWALVFEVPASEVPALQK